MTDKTSRGSSDTLKERGEYLLDNFTEATTVMEKNNTSCNSGIVRCLLRMTLLSEANELADKVTYIRLYRNDGTVTAVDLLQDL